MEKLDEMAGHHRLLDLTVPCASLHAQTLYVSQVGGTGTDGEYNATTGAAINANFITGLTQSPRGRALSGNNLFVMSGSTIGEYNAITGAAINANLITGLDDAIAIAVSGSILFVGTNNNARVGEYDATTGAAINATFITGLFPEGIARYRATTSSC